MLCTASQMLKATQNLELTGEIIALMVLMYTQALSQHG